MRDQILLLLIAVGLMESYQSKTEQCANIFLKIDKTIIRNYNLQLTTSLALTVSMCLTRTRQVCSATKVDQAIYIQYLAERKRAKKEISRTVSSMLFSILKIGSNGRTNDQLGHVKKATAKNLNG